MKKILKFLAIAIGALLALALLLVLTLPLWLGPIARPCAVPAVASLTGVDFKLDKLYLNPYTGRLEVGGMLVGNPKGYDEPVAVALSNLVLDVAMTTLGSKYVHVEEVTVDGFFASYVSGGEHGVDNFTQIQYNIAGGKEKYEANKAAAEAEKAKAEQNAAPEPEPEEEDVSKKKLVIDLLTIRNVRVKMGFLTIPIPVDIVLKDLGKETDGMTIGEIFDEVWKSIMKSATAVGDGMKALGGIIGDGAGKAAEGASKAMDAVSDGAGKAAAAVGESTGKAVDAVSETTGKAVDAVSETTGKAVDAVSDGAGKAVNAIKGLFN